MGWKEWQQNRKNRQQQQGGEENGVGESGLSGESGRQGRWQGKLSLVRASDGLLGRALCRKPDWVLNSGKRGQRLPQMKLRGDDDDDGHRFRSRRRTGGSASEEVLAPDDQQREHGTGLRVTFPFKFGVGLGTGGAIDSPSLALRIVNMKIGSDLAFPADDLAQDDDVTRHKRHSESLGSIASKAGDVLNTASVLLLAQAFCGPVISIAMTFMAGAGFTRFVTGRFFSLYNKDLEISHHLRERQWPQPLIDFSTVSLLLSIGVPVLKHQYPGLYRTLQCLGAAAPVALGYNETAAQVRASPEGAAAVGNALWRQRHRWAARRLCCYLSDFHSRPTIGWLVDIWERTSFFIIPHVLSNRMWVIGSTPLSVGRCSNESSTGGKAHSRTPKRPKQRQLSSVSSVAAAADEGDEQRIIEISDGGTGQGTNSMYLDFAILQNGWRTFLERSSLVCRGFYLFLIFGPLVIFGPMLYYISTVIAIAWGVKLRSFVWWMLRFCLEKGGAAFIKWGQWSATREDLFPTDLCQCLGRLHDRAPEHSYAETRRAVLKNLGRSIEDTFEDFPRKPFASGSIAQVYRAKLKTVREGLPQEVAVKVRHPSVALRIYQDFQIMSVLANWAQQLPSLRWLKLRESIDQFSHTLTTQTDLRVEAENLARFRKNFETLDRVVVFPKLVADLVSEGVIVEGFERGQALHEYLRNQSTLNSQIVAAGVDTYLKMLLTDNFLHTDLHPGNILARNADDNGQSVTQRAQIVLLDFGLAQELTPAVRYHFLSFMMMVGAGNGGRAAYHLLQFSWPQEQTCKSPDLLVEDMKHLFRRECNLRQYPIDLNAILIKVLQLCRKHELTIDSAYASLLVASCILVGFARSLDPELSIMDAAVPCLFFYNFTGRIMGQIYG